MQEEKVRTRTPEAGASRPRRRRLTLRLSKWGCRCATSNRRCGGRLQSGTSSFSCCQVYRRERLMVVKAMLMMIRTTTMMLGGRRRRGRWRRTATMTLTVTRRPACRRRSGGGGGFGGGHGRAREGKGLTPRCTCISL